VSRVRYITLRLLIVCLVLIFICFIWFSGLSSCLTLENVQRHAVWLQEQVTHYYWRTVALYGLCYLAVVLASLPVVFVMNMVGGYLFGVVAGVLYAIVAATLAAVIYFLLVRYVIGSYLQERYAQKLALFNQKFEVQGGLFLLTCRLIPVIPFFMVNLLAGLLTISMSTFIWTTAVGIFPSTSVFVYLGIGLNKINSFADLLSLDMLLLFALIVLVFVLPLIMLRSRMPFLR
jgi:uncharacterized membrane protein YdjX (TVP38/TMEM64 family)